MRILFNDFGGYAFAAQLARHLAKLGLDVDHCYCNSLSTTPSGNVGTGEDLANYRVCPIQLAEPLQKYSFVKRRKQEIEYGVRVAELMEHSRPDLVVSANTPLDALRSIWRAANRVQAKKVFWLQDVIGLAAKRILSKKIPLLGSLIGQYYVNLEQRLLRDSDLVLPISGAFQDYLTAARVPSNRIAVFENWAPIEETPCLPRKNDWSRTNNLDNSLVVLYSGTLSMKHDPAHILAVAKAIEPLGGMVVVRSQGLGADWLTQQKANGNFPNLAIAGYVPYDQLALSLASADVLLALLEPEAANYSVPSKVLTYLCSGRAVLLIAPTKNLAAQKLLVSQGGVVVDPSQSSQLPSIVADLAGNPDRIREMGSRAREFAQKEFDISRISTSFLQLLNSIS